MAPGGPRMFLECSEEETAQGTLPGQPLGDARNVRGAAGPAELTRSVMDYISARTSNQLAKTYCHVPHGLSEELG
eukprot:5385033-Pyramimonas_sp.AAC.1